MLSGAIKSIASIELNADTWEKFLQFATKHRAPIIIVISLILSVGAVSYRHIERMANIESKDYERSIAEQKRMLTSIQNFGVMPKLDRSWKRLLVIAKQNNVEVLIEKEPKKKAYDGAAKAWHGYLKGSSLDVMVTALYSQRVMPLYLGYLKISGGKAAISFSLTGV